MKRVSGVGGKSGAYIFGRFKGRRVGSIGIAFFGHIC